MNIKKLHFFSGLIISLFVGLHLFNHFYSLFGVDAHIQLMDKLRLVYRNIFAETILMFAVFIQIISGIKLFLKKRKTVAGFFGKLQIWSGLYLAVFFLIHLSAIMGGRFVLNLDTNIYFGTAGLNTFPFNLFFLPYYGLAIISFFGHIAAIHFHKMRSNLFGLTPEKQSQAIFFFGVVFSVIIIYGLTGGFTGIEIPKEYDVLIGK